MSAKITIESDDAALASALGVLVAQALQKSNFEAARAKTIMAYRQVVPAPEESATVTAMYGHPELMPLQYINDPNGNMFSEMVRLNPALLKAPVVMSFYPDTCPKYEEEVKHFLQHPAGEK